MQLTLRGVVRLGVERHEARAALGELFFEDLYINATGYAVPEESRHNIHAAGLYQIPHPVKTGTLQICPAPAVIRDLFQNPVALARRPLPECVLLVRE